MAELHFWQLKSFREVGIGLDSIREFKEKNLRLDEFIDDALAQ